MDAALLMLLKTYRQGAQSTAAVVGRIGIQRLPHQIGVLAQTIPTTRVGHRRAQHAVRMTDGVLRSRLNGNIHAIFQRFEQHARRPGVVDHNDNLRINRADSFHHPRYILDFHGDRTWRFEEYNFRFRTQKINDASTNQRIVIRCFHIEFTQDLIAKILSWLVGRARHQNMIATLNKRQNRIGHRRSAARVKRAANAAFQFAHCLLEGKVGVGSAATIKQLAICAIGGGEFFVFHGIKHQRRGALDNRIHRSLGVAFVATRNN